MNGQLDARAAGGERRSTGGRMNVSERRDEGRFGHEGRNFAEERTMRGERGAYARLSEGRGWRGSAACMPTRAPKAATGAAGAVIAEPIAPMLQGMTSATALVHYDYAPTYSYDVGVTAAPYTPRGWTLRTAVRTMGLVLASGLA